MGELQGRVFGGYQLEDEIGSGGVAEVYRARPVAGGGREVVVKVIYKEFARQPGFASNFAYVTEASARLASHPHILPLVGHGEENEYLYLVTPYVQAGTLADWIKKGGRLGAADVGPFFQQLCGALSYAHSLSVVHGNLKPSNIFLHDGRHVLLGDFGLLWDVRALDPSWSGNGVEAFEYLAPEVFGGQITQAGDIYSLGATLFHSLTGHTPFHMSKLSELIAAAQQQQPPSLSRQQPAVAPAIAALDPVVAQAMAKRPEERYQSAAQLAQTLEMTLHQAIATGAMASSQPMGQPQWQAMASTPVSAGVFDAPGQPVIAPVFGAPPVAPGALHGLLGTDVEDSMDQGGVALAGGMLPLPEAPLDPPTMRVPAPTFEPSTMRIAAPPGADAMGGLGAGTWNNPLIDGQSQPITAPRLRSGQLSGGDLSGALDDPRAADERYASSGLMPLDPSDDMIDANARRNSQRLPAVRAEHDAGAQSATFSPTELDLPRLTSPSMMASLPQDWQELLTDESARRRNDPFAASSALARPAPETYDGSVKGNGNRGATGWGVSEPARAWEAPEPDSSAKSLDDAFAERPRARARNADYDIETLTPNRSARAEDDFHDTMHEQKVWTNSHTILKLRRRLSAGSLVILILAALALVELAGFSVARPDLCVTHACAVVAGQIEKYAPNLQIPGAPAPVSFTPTALKVSATTNGAGTTSVTLTNTGSRAITWKASTTLGWLSVSPSSGSLAKGARITLTLTAQPGGVAPGSYSAGLVIDAATGQSAEPVSLTVMSGPILSVSPAKLAFSACGATQSLTIANTGAAKLTYSATPSQAGALSVNPGNGSVGPGAKATLSVTLSCNANIGQSYAVILVSDGGSQQTPVTYGQ